jgi:hypothetical protein
MKKTRMMDTSLNAMVNNYQSKFMSDYQTREAAEREEAA